MKPLLPLAVLLAVAIAGCGKSDPKSDPIAKYRDAQLKRGMQIADMKQQFGEPDSYEDWWNEDGDDSRYPRSSHKTSACPHHVEELGYGAFGAHDQRKGHITKHRLSMTFVDGALRTWEKSTPSNRE